MNEQDSERILVNVATTIADGHPVDWDTLIVEHPDVAAELEELRALQVVEGASRRAGKLRAPKDG